MFDDLMNETVILRIPDNNFSDGTPGYGEYPVRAFVFGYHERLLEKIGIGRDALFVIIAATPETVSAFGHNRLNIKIVRCGREYDLKTVRSCRGIDGKISCFSCAGV